MYKVRQVRGAAGTRTTHVWVDEPPSTSTRGGKYRAGQGTSLARAKANKTSSIEHQSRPPHGARPSASEWCRRARGLEVLAARAPLQASSKHCDMRATTSQNKHRPPWIPPEHTAPTSRGSAAPLFWATPGHAWATPPGHAWATLPGHACFGGSSLHLETSTANQRRSRPRWLRGC